MNGLGQSCNLVKSFMSATQVDQQNTMSDSDTRKQTKADYWG